MIGLLRNTILASLNNVQLKLVPLAPSDGARYQHVSNYKSGHMMMIFVINVFRRQGCPHLGPGAWAYCLFTPSGHKYHVVREASLRNYSLSIFYVQFYFLLSVFYFFLLLFFIIFYCPKPISRPSPFCSKLKYHARPTQA